MCRTLLSTPPPCGKGLAPLRGLPRKVHWSGYPTVLRCCEFPQPTAIHCERTLLEESGAMSILPAQPDNSWSFIFRQNIGLVLVIISGACLILGYDKNVISNGYLTCLCLVVAVIALILHETRPFQRWENIKQELDAKKREEESAELRRKQE